MIYRQDSGINIHHKTDYVKAYKRVIPGQFVVHLRSFQGGFAHSPVLGITSPAYTVFGFKRLEDHCDYFWKYYFSSDRFIKMLKTVTYGIRDGKSINYEEFLSTRLSLPNKKEQRKISSVFKRLDKLITLHQCEPKI